MPKKVVIIGAGISGMSVGTYLQMQGFSTEICEMNAVAGGLCTSWQRKSFIFDPCTHWLVGTKPSNVFYAIWQELGILEGAIIHDHQHFKKLVTPEGREFTLHAEVALLEQEMLAVAPEDSATIREYCNGLREAQRVNLPVFKSREVFSPLDFLIFPFKNWRLIRFLVTWRGRSIAQFATKFSNHELRGLFLNFFTDHEDFSMVSQMMTLGWHGNGEAGRPEGGSATVVENLKRRYESLGGKVHLRAPVEEILTNNGVVTGVRLKSGEEHTAEIVISTADLHFTLENLLKSGDKRKHYSYFKRFSPFPSFVDINIGLDAKFPLHETATTNYFSKKNIDLGNGHLSNSLCSHVFDFDATMAGEGKSVIMTHIRSTDFHYWQNLRHTDRALYESEKERIAEEVIVAVDEQFSGPDFSVREHVSVVDVCTPITYHRWTHNYRGSYEGWRPTPNALGLTLKKSVPGVKNFYFAGHWLEPGGGIPAAALSGRNVAQIICKKERIPFKILED